MSLLSNYVLGVGGGDVGDGGDGPRLASAPGYSMSSKGPPRRRRHQLWRLMLDVVNCKFIYHSVHNKSPKLLSTLYVSRKVASHVYLKHDFVHYKLSTAEA